MHLHAALLGALLILGRAADVSAVSLQDQLVRAVWRRASDHEENMRRQVHDILRKLDARGASTVSTTPQSADASQLDQTEWDAQTRQACDAAMAPLAAETMNPSGLALCYNVPFFNNSTGVFDAELRMYNLSAPFDPWTGVTAKDISMTFSYSSATVSAANGTFTKRDVDTTLSWPPIKERGLEANGKTVLRRATGPQEIKVLMYVGQIDSDSLSTAQTSAQLQALLIPTVRLTAINPSTNEALNTSLSSTQASFVSGVFSQKSTSTTSPASQAAISAAAVAISFRIPGQRLAPLQVPGLTLPINLLFPVGMIITLIWTLAFVVTVGWGTYGRIKFREQYRRRVKRDAAVGVRSL